MTLYRVRYSNPITPDLEMGRYFREAYLSACAYARRISRRHTAAYVIASDNMTGADHGHVTYRMGRRGEVKGRLSGGDPLIENWEQIVDEFEIRAVKLATGTKVHGTHPDQGKTFCGQPTRAGSPAVTGHIHKHHLCKRCFRKTPIEPVQRELKIKVIGQ